MSRLQVLMVSMKQKDFTVLEKSKIHSDAILSNQSNILFNESIINGNLKWQIITTNTKGVGVNRNIGLNHASAEICIFMDDDMICHEGYEQIITDYFDRNRKADVLIFNVNTIGMEMGRKKNTMMKRVKYYNFMNYGAVRIAIRLSSIKKANLSFSTLFGGGCIYSSGEDTLFLKNCLDSHLKIFTAPYCYADVFQIESSWYKGINEKYLYDKGALMKAMFKHTFLVFDIIFAIKLYKKANLTFCNSLKIMVAGSLNYMKLKSYEQYKGEHL